MHDHMFSLMNSRLNAIEQLLEVVLRQNQVSEQQAAQETSNNCGTEAAGIRGPSGFLVNEICISANEGAGYQVTGNIPSIRITLSNVATTS